MLRGRDHLGHHRRAPRDRAAPEVVAVGETPGEDNSVDAAQVVITVPEGDRLASGHSHRPQRVAVVERPREGDDTDAGAHVTGAPADRGGMAASLPAGRDRAGPRRKAFPMRLPVLAALA